MLTILRPLGAAATSAFLLTLGFVLPVGASPLDIGSWQQVARIAAGDNTMFDGNGDLNANYSFGLSTGDPLQSSDFQITFNTFTGMKILFITGDQEIWGLATYADLRTLIDAKTQSEQPNFAFDSRINGIEQQTVGNVLSRGSLEDPWIGLKGDHTFAIANALIVWGENNYNDGTGERAALKNAHQGINVYVQLETPLPAALPLFATVLAGGGLVAWRRKRRAATLATN